MGRAKQLLRKTNIRKIPRSEALAFANLARRLDLGQLSLRILRPIVCPERHHRKAPATPAERVEYAASLRGLGVIAEAQNILEAIDPKDCPQAALQLAFCFITEWRYRESIPALNAYVRTFKTPSYAMYVGKLNLLEALICDERRDEAAKLCHELLWELDEENFALHRLKCLELAAQFEMFLNGNPGKALRLLEKTSATADQSKYSRHSVMVRKYLCIARSLERGRPTPELSKVRDLAAGLGYWEIVRDCDFHRATLNGDRDRLVKLYFGTPFEAYRARILRSLGPSFKMPEELFWGGDGASPRTSPFDLAAAELRGSRGASLAPGQAVHRLLILLCQDFYQPVPFLSIFSKLNPGEAYHPDSSPNRVHQILFHFRRWIRENRLPLELGEESGGYKLRFKGLFGIAVPRTPLPLVQEELEFERLRLRVARDGSFTAPQAARGIGLSKSATHLLLRWAVESGKLLPDGNARRRTYRFAS